jgi:hypothetical protein
MPLQLSQCPHSFLLLSSFPSLRRHSVDRPSSARTPKGGAQRSKTSRRSRKLSEKSRSKYCKTKPPWNAAWKSSRTSPVRSTTSSARWEASSAPSLGISCPQMTRRCDQAVNMGPASKSEYAMGVPTGLPNAQAQQVCDAYIPNQADQRADHRGMNQAAVRPSVPSKVQQENQQPGVLANKGMGKAGCGEAGVSGVAQQIHYFEDHAKAGARIHEFDQRSKDLVHASRGIPASSQASSAFASNVSTSTKQPISAETPETNSPTLKHEETITKDAGRMTSP